MKFTLLIEGVRGEPVLLGLIAIFFLFSLLSAAMYFHVQRHKGGSIDWINRRKVGKFEAFTLHLPNFSDGLWLILTLALSALLRMVRIFCFLDLHTFSAQSYSDLITAVFSDSMLPTLALAAACYTLVRVVYGQPLVATLAAVLGAFTHSYQLWATTSIVMSLFFLYLWMAAKPDAPLFFNAFWFVFAGICYGIALLSCWATIYLMPLYIFAYAITQHYRWRKGDPEYRFAKLMGSIVLLLFSLLLGTFLLWLLYYLSEKGRVHILTILSSEELYAEMFPTILQKFQDLFERKGIRATFYAGDSFLLLLGLSSAFPALYEFVKHRKIIALTAVCALGFFTFLWLLGCVYMLMPALLLLIGGVWSSFAQRGYTRYTVFSCLAVTLCYIAELLLR